tara:strand:- start:60 stop:413 length:354 start_codon:yes stop_codon:yes gene_type:complete
LDHCFKSREIDLIILDSILLSLKDLIIIKKALFLLIFLMLQETFIIIVDFMFMLQHSKSSSVTVLTDLFVNKLVTPIPYLKDCLFFIYKTSAMTPKTIIFFNFSFFFIFNHKLQSVG